MDYKGIQEMVKSFLLTPTIEELVPTLVTQAQRSLERRMRLRAMEYYPSNGTLASGASTVAVPSDYIELIVFSIIDGTTRYPIFDRRSNKGFIEVVGRHSGDTTNTGRPAGIRRKGENFEFDRYANKEYTYEWAYYIHLTTLSAQSSTNWWTTNADDLLIYETLVKAIPLLPSVPARKGLADDPRGPKWILFRNQLEDELNTSEARERISGSSRRVRYID